MHGEEAPREQHADFVEADVAVAMPDGLGELSEHGEFGQRRHRTGTPMVPRIADRVDQRGIVVEGQADIATRMVVVRAQVVVTGMADQERAGDQFVRMPARAATEAALPHI